MLKQVEMASMNRTCKITSKTWKPKHTTKLSQLTKSKHTYQHTIQLHELLKPVASRQLYDTT